MMMEMGGQLRRDRSAVALVNTSGTRPDESPDGKATRPAPRSVMNMLDEWLGKTPLEVTGGGRR
jgi:hypothetical protein